MDNIIPKSIRSTNANIVISKVSERSYIFLRAGNKDFARIILTPEKDQHHTVSTKIISPNSTQPYNNKDNQYQISEILSPYHNKCLEREKGKKCEFWSQSPSSSDSELRIVITGPKE